LEIIDVGEDIEIMNKLTLKVWSSE